MGDGRRRALIAGAVGMVGAVLGIAGAGHAYLREWRRAIAWFALALGAGLILITTFADPTTPPAEMPVAVTGPLLVLLVLSAVDAYRVASRVGTDPSAPADAGVATCPNCGEEVDPDLDFCHWCTERLDSPGE